MDCPTCGRKIPEGKIECPRCKPPSFANDPRPIQPSPTRGSLPLGLAVGLVIALLGGYGWAVFAAYTGDLTAWPAVVIGAAVGLTIRFLGGEPSPLSGFVGVLCGLIGIGGGMALIYLQWEGDKESLMQAFDFMNIAFIFVGLSLSRSLTSPKQRRQPKSLAELPQK